MTRTIEHQISENATRTFVGRSTELTALRSAIEDPDRLVGLLHGPGGIGKTRLLRHALADPPAETAVTILDGRDVEPTPHGLHLALARSLGLPTGVIDTAGAAAASAVAPEIVRALAAAPRHVLAIDTYEVLGLIDTWLRTSLLPSLPASVFILLVGVGDRAVPRTAPGAGRLEPAASTRAR